MNPEQDPRYAEAIALHQQGRLKNARLLYESLYARFPYHAHLLASYGSCLAQLGQLESGLAYLEQALVYAPNLEFARANRASTLAVLNRFDDALTAYQSLPDSAANWEKRGDLLLRLGRLEDALTAYDAGLEIDPTARLHLGRGSVLTRLKRPDDALDAFAAAVALDPDLADAWCEHGKLLKDAKRFDEAVVSFNAALVANPRHLGAYVGLCAALLDLKQPDLALRTIDEVLALAQVKELYLSKATIHYHLHDYATGLACVEQAQALAPDDATVWAHRGYALRGLKRLPEARQAYERALTLNPADNDANWAYANLLLTMGDFLAGWKHYEWRWEREEGRHYKDAWPSAPRWLGDWSLQGRKLVVLCEQGMGDTLQFCRYLPLLTGLGADVTLMVQKPLVKLMATSFPGIKVLPNAGSTVGFDFFTQLLSMPLALRTTLHTIPCRPYLKADPVLVKRWFKRLGAKWRPRIGLAWSGNPHPKSDHKRTIPLAELAPILNRDADFYVLQKDVRETDDLTAFPNLHYLPEALDGFDSTAALAKNLDRIITIDTSIAHLTGGLGLETWVLLPHAACFRWLLDRDDSPWYPSMTLFRQPAPGDWSPVIARVAERLG